jgi:hypothetical protein
MRKTWSGRSLLFRLGGALLLFAAWRIAEWLGPLGRGHDGHEPAAVYGLCLLAFLCASAGAALLANGEGLFGTVARGELWTPHLDDGMDEPERPHR